MYAPQMRVAMKEPMSNVNTCNTVQNVVYTHLQDRAVERG